MAKQSVSLGSAPTGAGGDTFRSAASKLQANDNEVYAQLGADAEGNLPSALPIDKGGTGATDAAGARSNLGLGNAATRAVGTGLGQLMEVGTFGLGGNAEVYTGESGGFLEYHDGKSGLFFSNTASVEIGNRELPQYTSYVVSSLVTGGFFAIGGGVTQKNIWAVTGSVDNAVYPASFCILLSDANTTVDGNGFIKAASPIVQLFFDRAELNSEAHLQAVEFEKLAIGDYLLKGTTGFAQQGWYIETPKDANGNVLFSVIYDILDDGDISIKTYKKKFDLETASIVADLTSPVDIPEGRWIDIRLQELPQPEFVPPVAHTPADFQPTGISKAVSEMMNGTEQ